jgi:subtilisin family serine protease
VYGSPVYGSPVYGSGDYAASGRRKSSVRPAPEDSSTEILEQNYATALNEQAPHIVILDTGLSGIPNRPEALDYDRIAAEAVVDLDAPDEDGDLDLDPAAGHGTFIAGVIDQVQPGCEINLRRVLSTYGDGDEAFIAKRLEQLEIADPKHTIINLSFGGYTLENPAALEWAIRRLQARGVVVVASAGNDGTCIPQFPAAFEDVVSVGALGPSGPAPFSNYGSWVRACAPGVDILSSFFKAFGGGGTASSGPDDPDYFHGWGLWSGTSFSAPIVVGALAKAMFATGCTGKEAVARLIEAPSLLRIADMGTVVNG